jgi:hypothetical protein
MTARGAYNFSTILPLEASALALQPDGKIIVTATNGTPESPGDFAVMRYSARATSIRPSAAETDW